MTRPRACVAIAGMILLGVMSAYQTVDFLEHWRQPVVSGTRDSESVRSVSSGVALAAPVPTLAPPRVTQDLAASSHLRRSLAQPVYVRVETDQPGLEVELVNE